MQLLQASRSHQGLLSVILAPLARQQQRQLVYVTHSHALPWPPSHHATTAAATTQATNASAGPRWAIAIHGGAGVINATNQEWLDDAYAGLQAALKAGQVVLEGGGSALDAVEAAVRQLEDEPHFNAGVH